MVLLARVQKARENHCADPECLVLLDRLAGTSHLDTQQDAMNTHLKIVEFEVYTQHSMWTKTEDLLNVLLVYKGSTGQSECAGGSRAVLRYHRAVHQSRPRYTN
jgi:hypothetical protein